MRYFFWILFVLALSAPTEVIGGNCVDGAKADGCIIFPGTAMTLADRTGQVWSFENTATAYNGTLTRVNMNHAVPLGAGGIDGGQWADALMLANRGQVYTRGWNKTWYQLTPTGSSSLIHTAIGEIRSPSFTTTADPTWITTTAGSTPQDLGIGAPKSNLYAQGELAITVDQTPTNGTVILSDGVTPVSSGQTITLEELTSLRFLPPATGRRYQQESSFGYIVRDPAGQGSVGFVGISVRPSLLWEDPVITKFGGKGIEYPPTVPQPTGLGDLVGFLLQNTTGAAMSGSVYFGQVFMPGTVWATDNLCATPTGAPRCSVYVQMDVKAKNNDASVRHAVLSLNSPSIKANGALGFLLLKCGGSGEPSCPSTRKPAADKIALANSSYDVTPNLTFTAGGSGSETPSCKSVLAAANAGTGPVTPNSTQTWLDGPIVKAYTAVGTADGGKLKVQCDIYSFSDGTIVTDLILGNDWAFQNGKNDIVYSVSIPQDGFDQNGVKQFLYSRYVHTVTSAKHITPNVQYDVPYLISTGAVPAYDATFGVLYSAIQGNLCGDPVRSTACFQLNNGKSTGNITPGWGQPGDRQDIAFVPNWQSLWLMSQNQAAFQTIIADARFAGNVPWNWTDEATGVPICGDASCSHPVTNFRSGTNLAQGDPCQGSCSNGNPFLDFLSTLGVAHMPDFAYFPYLATGNHYLMELFVTQADYAIVFQLHAYNNSFDVTGHHRAGFLGQFNWSPHNLGCSGGGLPCFDWGQVRQTAWTLRSVAVGAYLTPDSHPLKQFFRNQIAEGINARVQSLIGNNEDIAYGAMRGTLQTQLNSADAGVTDPWLDDYNQVALGMAAGMQLPIASPAARRWMQYINNFASGLLSSGQKGFPAFNGTAYQFQSLCMLTGCPPGAGTHPVNGFPNGSQPMNSLAVALQNNFSRMPPFGTMSGAAPGFADSLGYPQGGHCESGPGQQGGTMGSYCVIRQASLAGTISRVSNVGSIQGWAFEHVGQLLAMIQNPGGALTYGDLITSYRTRNQWDIAPQLPDGSFFSESNMQFQISGSPSLTCRANPCLLGIFVERGSTYNLTGAHGGSIDVMTVAAVGGSQTGGPPNGPGTGGGGGGTGMMRAGSADSYMFGGCGAGTFIGGSGNDIIVPGANCYGALAAQTIQFDIKTIGKTKQIGYATDYAGYVGRFRPGTDTLKIKSTIDAQNPPFSRPSDFTNHCSVIDGDTVCALPGNNVIVLKGVTSSLGSSVMIF